MSVSDDLKKHGLEEVIHDAEANVINGKRFEAAMTAEKPEWWRKENRTWSDIDARVKEDPHNTAWELLAVIDRQEEEHEGFAVALDDANAVICRREKELAAAEEEKNAAIALRNEFMEARTAKGRELNRVRDELTELRAKLAASEERERRAFERGAVWGQERGMEGWDGGEMDDAIDSHLASQAAEKKQTRTVTATITHVGRAVPELIIEEEEP